MLNPFARGARRFLFSCLVAVALLVVADRAGLWAAQHDVAKRLQADAHLHATPKVEIHDPLAPHKDLLRTYSDTDIHNLTAYLVTLK